MTSVAAAGQIVASAEKHNSAATIIVAHSRRPLIILVLPQLRVHVYLTELRGFYSHQKKHLGTRITAGTQVNSQRQTHFCPVALYKLNHYRGVVQRRRGPCAAGSSLFTKRCHFFAKKRRATPLPFLVLTPLLDRTFAIGHCGLTCVVCCVSLSARYLQMLAYHLPVPSYLRRQVTPCQLPVPETPRDIKRNSICIAWIYTNP